MVGEGCFSTPIGKYPMVVIAGIIQGPHNLSWYHRHKGRESHPVRVFNLCLSGVWYSRYHSLLHRHTTTPAQSRREVLLDDLFKLLPRIIVLLQLIGIGILLLLDLGLSSHYKRRENWILFFFIAGDYAASSANKLSQRSSSWDGGEFEQIVDGLSWSETSTNHRILWSSSPNFKRKMNDKQAKFKEIETPKNNRKHNISIISSLISFSSSLLLI